MIVLIGATMAEGNGLNEIPELSAIYKQIKYATLKAIVETSTSTSAELIIDELEKALSNTGIRRRISDIMPYLYAAGFLSFVGREINEQTLSSVVSAIGIKTDQNLVDIVLKTGIKSHLIYVYTYYFLIATGQDPTPTAFYQVIKAIGLTPDQARIEEISQFLSASNPLK